MMRTWMLLIALCLCACQSGGDDLQFESPQSASGNPGGFFSAVIGQDVNIFRADAQQFQEPLDVSLNDDHGGHFQVTHQFSNNRLTFKIPPGIASGDLELVVQSGLQSYRGNLTVRRLGVIANRGSSSLLVFDVDKPETSQTLLFDGEIAYQPEAVTISPDGRFAQIGLVGTPALVTVDLVQNPPAIVSDALPTAADPLAIALIPSGSLALSVNFGRPTQPGQSIDIFQLDAEGKLFDELANVPVGSQSIAAAPFDAAVSNHGGLFAVVTNQNDSSLTRINLNGCVSQPGPNCAQTTTLQIPASPNSGNPTMPSGLSLYPNEQKALVLDYANHEVIEIDIDRNFNLSLSGRLALSGGDQGPVAVRITPGGGRALVLNETSATLAVLDLTSGSPQIFQSLDLGGLTPGKIAFSHDGGVAWITCTGSNEVMTVLLHLQNPVVLPFPIPGLNNPRGIAIQP